MTGPLRILAAAAIVSIAPALTGCAYAQYGAHRDRGYGRAYASAYEIGYREGLEHGARDGRSGRDFAYAHDAEYRRADRGWHPRYGDRQTYRYEFRRGYERGYREAYARYGGYGRDGRYRGPYSNAPRGSYPGYPTGAYGGRYGSASPAAEYGFNEGYRKGREDARDGDRYDPVRHKWYREGDRHYNGRYGSRDEWKYVYREAFKQGYDRGYREGRY